MNAGTVLANTLWAAGNLGAARRFAAALCEPEAVQAVVPEEYTPKNWSPANSGKHDGTSHTITTSVPGANGTSPIIVAPEPKVEANGDGHAAKPAPEAPPK